MLSGEAEEQLKIRIFDSLGTAIGAVAGEPVRMIRDHLQDFSCAGQSHLIEDGTTGRDLAALNNSALVRYPD